MRVYFELRAGAFRAALGGIMSRFGGEGDRVRVNTARPGLQKIDAEIEKRGRYSATQPKHLISARIAALDREWDMERYLETNASSIALSSLVLGLTVNRKWLAV